MSYTSIYFTYIYFKKVVTKHYSDWLIVHPVINPTESLSFSSFSLSHLTVIFFKSIYMERWTISHIFLINDEVTEKFIISTSDFQALLISLDAHLHQKERKLDFRNILIFSRNDSSPPHAHRYWDKLLSLRSHLMRDPFVIKIVVAWSIDAFAYINLFSRNHLRISKYIGKHSISSTSV